MPINTFSSVATRTSGLAIDGTSRDFTVRVDEPTELGGTDTGPNPVELLLTSLGTCQAIALTSFAPKFDVLLDAVRVQVEGDIDLTGFLGTADVRPGFQELRVTLHVSTDASQEALDALVAYTDTHCPVGDTLSKGTRVAPPTLVREATR